jgi:hypothetical protein
MILGRFRIRNKFSNRSAHRAAIMPGLGRRHFPIGLSGWIPGRSPKNRSPLVPFGPQAFGSGSAVLIPPTGGLGMI